MKNVRFMAYFEPARHVSEMKAIGERYSVGSMITTVEDLSTISNGDYVMIMLKEIYIREVKPLRDIHAKAKPLAEQIISAIENPVHFLKELIEKNDRTGKASITVAIEFKTADRTISIPLGPYDVVDKWKYPNPDDHDDSNPVVIVLPRTRVKDFLFITCNLTATLMAWARIEHIGKILSRVGDIATVVPGDSGTISSGILHTIGDLINVAAKENEDDFLINHTVKTTIKGTPKLDQLEVLGDGGTINFLEDTNEVQNLKDEEKTRVIFEVVKLERLQSPQEAQLPVTTTKNS